MRVRSLKEYTEGTEIPEALQLSGGEFRQLFDVIDAAPDRIDGEFEALCLAYRAGYKAGHLGSGKSNLLKESRELRGISQEDLSELTGVSCSLINMIENGYEATINTRGIAKLAQALSVDPFDLFPN